MHGCRCTYDVSNPFQLQEGGVSMYIGKFKLKKPFQILLATLTTYTIVNMLIECFICCKQNQCQNWWVQLVGVEEEEVEGVGRKEARKLWNRMLKLLLVKVGTYVLSKRSLCQVGLNGCGNHCTIGQRKTVYDRHCANDRHKNCVCMGIANGGLIISHASSKPWK